MHVHSSQPQNIDYLWIQNGHSCDHPSLLMFEILWTSIHNIWYIDLLIHSTHTQLNSKANTSGWIRATRNKKPCTTQAESLSLKFLVQERKLWGLPPSSVCSSTDAEKVKRLSKMPRKSFLRLVAPTNSTQPNVGASLHLWIANKSIDKQYSATASTKSAARGAYVCACIVYVCMYVCMYACMYTCFLIVLFLSVNKILTYDLNMFLHIHVFDNCYWHFQLCYRHCNVLNTCFE